MRILICLASMFRNPVVLRLPYRHWHLALALTPTCLVLVLYFLFLGIASTTTALISLRLLVRTGIVKRTKSGLLQQPCSQRP